jgi:hypothetical protein
VIAVRFSREGREELSFLRYTTIVLTSVTAAAILLFLTTVS